MALPTDNVFHQLELQLGEPLVMQLALVLMASSDVSHALDMLSGQSYPLPEQRKRLIVLLGGFRPQGPDDGRTPYKSLKDQAHCYVKHTL